MVIALEAKVVKRALKIVELVILEHPAQPTISALVLFVVAACARRPRSCGLLVSAPRSVARVTRVSLGRAWRRVRRRARRRGSIRARGRRIRICMRARAWAAVSSGSTCRRAAAARRATHQTVSAAPPARMLVFAKATPPVSAAP